MRTRTARTATLVAAAALAGSGLIFTGPAAQAAPVFTTSTFTSSAFAHDDSACTESNQVEQPDTVVPLTENGPAATLSAASSVTATGAATDVMNGSTSGTASGSVSSIGTNLKSIDHVAAGPVNVTATTSPSACNLHMFADTQVDFDFTVTSPGFLTIDIAHKGPAYTEFYLSSVTPDDSSYYDEYGTGFDTTTSRRIFLPAGTYTGTSTVSIGVSGRSTALQGQGTGSIHATFALIGSPTAAVQGKAKKYVTYPATRVCATHVVTASITSKKKRVAKIQQVTFFVNDQKVKKVKTPDKGDTYSLPVADNVDADLRAEVKLFPSRPGRKAKVQEVSASYLACAP
jgi:hypothetical protein